MRRLTISSWAACCLLACSGPMSDPDAGGAGMDAGEVDAARPDDAGATDDTGPGDDAGVPPGDDAGVPPGDDAAVPSDAGAWDAGAWDAATAFDASGGCSSAGDCGPTTCRTDSSGRCVQVTPTCTSGSCGTTTATGGGACNASTGMCERVDAGTRDAGTIDAGTSGCTLDSDCGTPTCSDTPTGCLQSTPTCAGSMCRTLSMSTPGTCDASTGLCGPSTGGCRVDCDCPQGLLCAGGACLVGIVPAYCCTTAGCPSGSTCTFPDGSAGTCPP